MVPFTRWERRTQTVQVPITQREMVPEKRSVQVPVTRQVIEEQEVITRVAVGPAARKPFTSGGDPFSSAPSSLASRPTTVGGVKQLNGDLSGSGTVRR